MSKIPDRIGIYCSKKNLSIRKLESAIGASNGLISGAIKKGSDISSAWISLIVENFRDINPRWLLTGEGDMLLNEKQTTILSLIPSTSPQEGIPLIPINAWGGSLQGVHDTIMDYDCDRYIIPLFKGADFLISVRGDSMVPKYYSGDIVACKRVFISDIWFQWGKVYILDTAQGSILKRVRKGKDDDTILLVSENQDYEPFELHKDQIYNIALVVGVIRAE